MSTSKNEKYIVSYFSPTYAAWLEYKTFDHPQDVEEYINDPQYRVRKMSFYKNSSGTLLKHYESLSNLPQEAPIEKPATRRYYRRKEDTAETPNTNSLFKDIWVNKVNNKRRSRG